MKTLTRSQIKKLRAEAYEASDFVMAGICELAMDRFASADDCLKELTKAGNVGHDRLMGFINHNDPVMAAQRACALVWEMAETEAEVTA